VSARTLITSRSISSSIRYSSFVREALARAVTTGKLGFDDLKRVALSAMAEIASASLRSLFRSADAGAGVGASLLGGLTSVVGSLLGLPGRATGGPVSGGRGYVVGERGPELFVPSRSGRIEPITAGGGRDVRVAISVHTPAPTNPQVLGQSSRQIARAVRSALRSERP
jgi:phage-related minor tail protein